MNGPVPSGNPHLDGHGDIGWSHRIPLAVGAFALCVAAVLALQHHEFTRPNLGLLAIGLAVLPWVIDMALCQVPEERVGWWERARFGLPFLVGWTAVVLAAILWMTASYPVSNDFAPFVITLLVGEMASVRGWQFGLAVWAASSAGLLAYSTANDINGMWIWVFAFTIAWMGGVAFRRQVAMTSELTQAQTQLARQAAEEERTRLARDVHDLVAHSLAVTMLQLSGARLALQAGELDEADDALREAEAAGRTAMAEIHRTVGLLGAGSGAGMSPATPNAADLPTLVAEFRRAGLTVHLQLRGDLAEVPLAVGLASYRLVQESLANAVKHAPGAPVRLEVAVDHHVIDILVANPITQSAAGPGGGNGLRGMAERAQLLGGVASAGNGDGSWKVHAAIPWEAAPA